ncbi:MAG: hypothetical protein GY903_04640 [Fuerstiella sp.]|nr:hypothetical protein [Fuerstiella sp.]
MRIDICFFRQHWLVMVTAVAVAAIVGDVSATEPESSPTDDPYPLVKCVILDGALDDGADVLYVGDREIRVCCQECVNEFSGSEETWIGVVDELIIEQQVPYYPLNKCIVDGKLLDDFSTIDKVVGNRLFRVCSDDCCQAVEQQPATYFGVLNKAVIKKQKPTYPLAKCVVSDEALGKHAIDHVVGNQLIRLSSSEQLDRFDTNPGKYLQELRQLMKKKAR